MRIEIKKSMMLGFQMTTFAIAELIKHYLGGSAEHHFGEVAMESKFNQADLYLRKVDVTGSVEIYDAASGKLQARQFYARTAVMQVLGSEWVPQSIELVIGLPGRIQTFVHLASRCHFKETGGFVLESPAYTHQSGEKELAGVRGARHISS